MTDRTRTLMRAILTQLKNRPPHFPYPDAALMASVRLAVCPAPEHAEFREVMSRLENDAYVHRDDTGLDGRRWTITGMGRAYLAD